MRSADAPLSMAAIGRALVPPLLVGFAVSFVLTILSLALPLYTIQIFMRVISSRSVETLIMLTVAVTLAMVSSGILEELRRALHRRMGHWLTQRLSRESLEALLRQTLERKDIVGRAFNDLSKCHTFLAGPSIPTAFDLFWSPLFIIVLYILHPSFAFICLVSLSVMVILGVLNELMTHSPQEEARLHSGQANTHLQAAMRNAETIEAMGVLDPFARAWHKDYMAGVDASTRAIGRASVIRSLSSFSQMMAMVAITAMAAYLVLDDQVGGGSLMAAMILSRLALKPYGSIIANWREWIAVHGAVRRLAQDLAPESSQRQRSTMELPRLDGGLVVERVVYVPVGGSKAILHGVSFTVAPGEAVGIVGNSGSGKTTLARLLMGVFNPTTGRVLLGGHDVFTWERTSFGRAVGFLSQDVELFPATVAENIARLQDADPSAVIWAAKEVGIHEMIGTLPHGYSTRIGPGGFPLTRGQQQRIALARALFGNPSLLVLDEPDASLDQEGERALQRAVVRAKNRGAVVVIITHRRTIMPALDRVVVMAGGRVEAIQSLSEAAAGAAGATGDGAVLVHRPARKALT